MVANHDEHHPNGYPSARGLSRRDFLTRGVGASLSLGPAASLLAACGGSSGNSKPGKISLWHGWTGGINTQSLNHIIDQFNHKNKADITVKPTALQWDNLFSKLAVSAASGNAPDVVLYHQSEVAEFASRGITKPIGDLVKDSSIDFAAAPKPILNATEWEGERHAVPLDLHPLGMYYNVDMVKKAGLDPAAPPKNRDELLSWAKELTREAHGEYGINIPYTGAGPRWFWWSLLYQNGGQFLTGDGKSDLDSDAAKEALQFVVDLFHRYKVAKPEVKAEADPVARKKAAIWFTGPWEVTQRLDQEVNFGTAPVPVIGDKPAAWANAHAMAIPNQRSDGKYEEGITWTSWFYRHYGLPATRVGVVPLGKTARNSKVYTEDKRYEYYKPFITELEDVALEPSIPEYTKIFSFGKPTPMTTNLEAALSKAKSVTQALKDMKAGVDEQLTR